LEVRAGRERQAIYHEIDETHESGSTAKTQRRQEEGYRVTYLPVDRDGLLMLADLENAITDSTASRQRIWFLLDAGNTTAEIKTMRAALKTTTGMLRA